MNKNSQGVYCLLQVLHVSTLGTWQFSGKRCASLLCFLSRYYASFTSCSFLRRDLQKLEGSHLHKLSTSTYHKCTCMYSKYNVILCIQTYSQSIVPYGTAVLVSHKPRWSVGKLSGRYIHVLHWWPALHHGSNIGRTFLLFLWNYTADPYFKDELWSFDDKILISRICHMMVRFQDKWR